MEAVLFESNTRQELKEFVSLAKKIGISVRYPKNNDVFLTPPYERAETAKKIWKL
ncbi:MAG: hypothetical protein FWF51_04095 [Chitinivibrionia bacterium]|nr:hypothetical protein [Chitinivibrionia bacterium]